MIHGLIISRCFLPPAFDPLLLVMGPNKRTSEQAKHYHLTESFPLNDPKSSARQTCFGCQASGGQQRSKATGGDREKPTAWLQSKPPETLGQKQICKLQTGGQPFGSHIASAFHNGNQQITTVNNSTVAGTRRMQQSARALFLHTQHKHHRHRHHYRRFRFRTRVRFVVIFIIRVLSVPVRLGPFGCECVRGW